MNIYANLKHHITLNLILIVCSKTLTPFDTFYNTTHASHKQATTSADTGFTGKANIAVGTQSKNSKGSEILVD